ncbi:diguanylate cyclase domain-containing protein [Methylicorpusculum sp.]|uniref:diguanylate cyclase domain-containing protein n=1 Tax=Methylicorpusculum sp. TaxID=2713644 RepID=UPI002731773C|nr:diguanylate cyclase [Methylicorpusculum sp.]MDP2178734.1 diguanylate cyclase [Methylicorpusculum sp.]MDZ4150293.1 diguanylate cyclase [Methylicorpusculum sp.]
MNAVFNKTDIRLLLVDDDRFDRLACKHALNQYQNFSCLFIEAETGNQGLELARSQQPDCILLDYQLPDLNGVEFLAELADDLGKLPIPVVMLAESNNPSIIADALKMGVSDYVIKGWNWESLQWLSGTVFHILREKQAIRDKEEAFEKQREAEEKYRKLVEQIPAITYMASMEIPGKLLYLSPQIHQLGFASEYWLNDSHGLLKQVHPDDLSVTIEAYAHTYEYHAPLRCEYRLIGSDGKPRWFLDEANIVRSQQGESLFLQGILVDITKSKETEQELYYYRQHLEELVAERTLQLETQCARLTSAKDNLDKAFSKIRQTNSDLRASEQRFRLLLDSAGEGILGLDAAGCCTFVNRAALAMLDYTHEEILGQNIRTLLNHDCMPELTTVPEQNTLCESIARRCTGKFHGKDGRILPVECSSYPIEIDGRTDGTVLMFWDVTESQALIQKLSYQASHDPLTGLCNRTEFEKRTSRVMASAIKDQSEHVLCYLDLDHFKAINDSCGHAAGDQLLSALGTELSSKLRQRDTLARLGGDEFALLLEHSRLDQAWSIANDICEFISNFKFTWASKDYSVSASIGITTLTNEDSDITAVLCAADTACYIAKKQGGNRVHIATKAGDEALVR